MDGSSDLMRNKQASDTFTDRQTLILTYWQPIQMPRGHHKQMEQQSSQQMKFGSILFDTLKEIRCMSTWKKKGREVI